MSSIRELDPPTVRRDGPFPGPGPDPDPWIPRFGRTERFAHWWTATMMAIALLTGLSMGDDGGSGPMLVIHVGAVVSIGVGLAAACIFGNRRALRRFAASLFRLDRRDIGWLRARMRHPVHGAPQPEWGMFNTGQKLLTWAVIASVVGVIATGIQAAASGGEGGAHGTLVALTGILLSCHVFMAVVNRATRPALPGMVFGRVRRSWAAKHHRAWLDDVER
jgi:formate dehydrogenase subunit gamma